jgi:poly-gamma-glutamate synthesis protein (capsule biosynthesis protein)
MKAAALAVLLLGLAPVAQAEDFTIAAAGDLIISRPISMLAQPGSFPHAQAFADLQQLLANADTTYGNMETSILDIRNFAGHPYSWDGDWMLTAAPSVSADLKRMHFDIVSAANNHALDWGVEGMRETARHLDNAGLAHAGTGENLHEAGAPSYYESSKGRVGLVSMVSTFRPTTNALDAAPHAPFGRPGVNKLALDPTLLVDDASFLQLANIAESFHQKAEGVIDLFGAHIRRARGGERAFTYSYAMDEGDLTRILAAIRVGKANSRYVIASIHAHEASTDEDPPRTWQDPAAFLRTLAQKTIDEGADMFVATGIHHVGGIEIYRGKPIFYGLGNFFWSDMQEPLSAELHGSAGNLAALEESYIHPDRATDADLTALLNATTPGFATPGPTQLNRTFQSFLARATYDDRNSRLREIRIYPVDLGYGEPLTSSGIPYRAGPSVARSVLERVIALSDPASVSIRLVRENGYLIGIASPAGKGVRSEN